jgi:hypothetical protein
MRANRDEIPKLKAKVSTFIENQKRKCVTQTWLITQTKPTQRTGAVKSLHTSPRNLANTRLWGKSSIFLAIPSLPLELTVTSMYTYKASKLTFRLPPSKQ